MIFATAANVIPLLVSAAHAAPKGLAHTAIIHPDFWGRSLGSVTVIQSMRLSPTALRVSADGEKRFLESPLPFHAGSDFCGTMIAHRLRYVPPLGPMYASGQYLPVPN
jgi:hypothetical protein